MSKKNKRRNLSSIEFEPFKGEFILDEGFIMCASGFGCESKNCKGTNLNCQSMAFYSIVEAARRKYLLVVDENGKARSFYSKKADAGKISRDIAKLIFINWLDGHGRKSHKYPIKPLPQKIIENCPTATKENRLDGLLCQLALASNAPIWTVDSDFDCVNKIEPIIVYMDPVDTYTDMYPNDSLIEQDQ